MKKRVEYCCWILLSVVIMIVTLSAIEFFGRDNEKIEWAYAIEDVICIGDSLTSGSYLSGDKPGDIQQNYPWYLERMINTNVTNAGVAGYSASDWYEKELDKYDFREYGAAVIWLGTNNGMSPDIDTDVWPYIETGEYALTEMGYYCRIIDEMLSENPEMLIILMQVFASKDNVKETNEAIVQIAEHYGLLAVDCSSLNMEETQLHSGLTNPHFGKAGNIAVAELLVDELNRWFEEDPLRCEFNHKYK